LNAAAAGTILEESWKREKEEELGAYLYALIRANLKTMREVVTMKVDELAWEELMEEIGLTDILEARWVAKWEAKLETRGKKNGWKEAIELLKQGYTVEQLEQMSPTA
jgi:uncharacterized membrane-anchored protein